jgi:hypothetical protein
MGAYGVRLLGPKWHVSFSPRSRCVVSGVVPPSRSERHSSEDATLLKASVRIYGRPSSWPARWSTADKGRIVAHPTRGAVVYHVAASARLAQGCAGWPAGPSGRATACSGGPRGQRGGRICERGIDRGRDCGGSGSRGKRC